MALVYNPSRQNGLYSADRLIRHQEIRDALKERGYTISGVARDLGISAATVTTVSQGYRRSARVEEYLAQLLGVSTACLFPERYQEEHRQ